jgi:NAD(P)-dependent dehydrogenase (short-subunit alcohol dehydrogenase family)
MNAISKVAMIKGASQGIGAELVRAGSRERGVRNSRSIRPEDFSEGLAVAGDMRGGE